MKEAQCYDFSFPATAPFSVNYFTKVTKTLYHDIFTHPLKISPLQHFTHRRIRSGLQKSKSKENNGKSTCTNRL